MRPTERLLLNLSAAFSKTLKSETFALYLEKLDRFQARHCFSEGKWSAITSRLISECEKFPALSEIYPYLINERRKTGNTIPIFRTWKDEQDRTWAQKTGSVQSEVPDPQTIEEWKQEACSGEQARAAFRAGWMSRPGASLAKCDAMFNRIDRMMQPATPTLLPELIQEYEIEDEEITF